MQVGPEWRLHVFAAILCLGLCSCLRDVSRFRELVLVFSFSRSTASLLTAMGSYLDIYRSQPLVLILILIRSHGSNQSSRFRILPTSPPYSYPNLPWRYQPYIHDPSIAAGTITLYH